MKPILTGILVALFFLIVPITSHAHRVTVFAWVDGETVIVESKFSGGKKVKNGRVTVLDTHGTPLVTGTTSETGEFRFPAPRSPQELTVRVNAGIGHQGIWVIGAGEFSATSVTPVPAPEAARLPALNQTVQTDHPASAVLPPISDLKAQMKALIREELAPVKRDLAHLKERPVDIRDILGGIGYIIGVFGLIAWLKSPGSKASAETDAS